MSDRSETLKGILPALVAAQAAFGAAKKDGTNPHFKAKYVTLGSIWDAVAEPLSKNHLAISQGAEAQDDHGVTVTTFLYHGPSAEFISNTIRVPVSKIDAQGVGSAITYGRRYGLAALLGIVADDDDDGNAAVASQRSAPASAPRPTYTPPVNNTGGPVMPFGKTKGTPLAQLKTAEVESALAWAKEKDKFKEFQVEAGNELARRLGPPLMDQMPEGLDGDDFEEAPLPF